MLSRLLPCLLFALSCFPGSGNAASLAGVELPDEVRIAGLDQPLMLNGTGVRKKFFIDVYVAGLYLVRPQVGVGSLLEVPTPNRVTMHFLHRQVAKDKLDAAWREGFANNLSQQQFGAVQNRLERFMAVFGDMRAGDEVWLDFVPGRGTRVTINGALTATIEGDDFNLALLGVWLGREPVSEALKNAMVGVDKG